MKKLAVVDISSFIFRAFFAVRPLHAPDGTPVNAVYGVLSMLLKLLSEYRPTHIVLARDLRGGSFRNELYTEYKANRSEPPEDLIPQFDLIKQLIDKLHLPAIAIENYEADDVIGSIVTQWKDQFDEIDIISGDKDLMQFIGDNIKMVDTQKGKIYGREEVFSKMGVYPEQVLDYLSMVGDSSDNVPGMKGIGAKGAAKLLAEYKTLEECIAHRDELKNKRVRTAFFEHLDDAYLSKKLISIVSDLELGKQPEDVEYKFSPDEQLYEFLQNLGFNSFVKKIKNMIADEQLAISQTAEAEFVIEKNSIFDTFNYQLVTIEKVDKIIKKLKIEQELFWFAQYADACSIIYVAIATTEKDFFVFDFRQQQYLPVLQLWSNPETLIYSFDAQKDLLYLAANEIKISANYRSIGQAHFIVNSTGKSTIEFLTSHYLLENLSQLERGEKLETMYDERFTRYAGERVAALSMFSEEVFKQLAEKKLEHIYKTFDAPLLPILSSMEKEGILINAKFFNELQKTFKTKIDSIEQQIKHFSGDKINLKSPKQVSILLFEKLNLPVIKKTKTGFSTDSEVLEKLKIHSDVPGLILEYRELDKLLSTYVKVIPEMVWSDGRIHTHFNLNIAATGRLSSTNPNLQNIPVRSENGKLIRKGFVAAPGKLLLSADYSQVELRLLAHFSEDDVMLKAFHDGLDIHAQTAAEVERVPLDQVTKQQRSRAKAVNFGLMYGQSAFGLAASLGISRSEAKEYINFYFERFGKIKGYLDSLKEFALNHGYVETLHGRKRFIPDIYSKNRTVKAMAERVAINSPVQGTAADIIKLAMIRIAEKIKEKGMIAKMLLQVHDELIFELPDNELKTLTDLVKSEMENVVELKVPLKVDIGFGVNWFDLK